MIISAYAAGVPTLTRIRFWLVILIIGLVASGVTAFPLEWETGILVRLVHLGFLDRVHEGLVQTYQHYPFIAYGTDWLAYAHLIIAVAFIGPLRDPVRNIWVIQFGVIACAGIIPLALICGPIRGIPFYWTLIDMSFGVLGVVPLAFAWRLTRRLEREAGGADLSVAARI